MERYEGYMPKGIKAARAERLIRADSYARSAARVLSVVFLVLLAALMAFFAWILSNGVYDTYGNVFIILLLIYEAVYIAFFVVFLIGRLLYGGHSHAARVTELLNSYIRGLLGDTYAAYVREIANHKDAKMLKKRLRAYVTSYTVTARERSLLLAKGALRTEGERIRQRYEDFIKFLLSDDPMRERYLVMSDNMIKVVEKWRRLHLSKYADPQKEIIEENIARVLRSATDERERFLAERGTREYMLLLRDVSLYRDPANPKAPRLPLPNREQYAHISEIVKKLRKFSRREMTFALHGKKLEDFKMYLDAYEDFASRFAMVGCPTLSIKTYHDKLTAAKADTEACWFCHTKFNLRYRKVCPRCKHYVCPKCGRCYCNKHIVRVVTSTVTED